MSFSIFRPIFNPLTAKPAHISPPNSLPISSSWTSNTFNNHPPCRLSLYTKPRHVPHAHPLDRVKKRAFDRCYDDDDYYSDEEEAAVPEIRCPCCNKKFAIRVEGEEESDWEDEAVTSDWEDDNTSRKRKRPSSGREPSGRRSPRRQRRS